MKNQKEDRISLHNDGRAILPSRNILTIYCKYYNTILHPCRVSMFDFIISVNYLYAMIRAIVGKTL